MALLKNTWGCPLASTCMSTHSHSPTYHLTSDGPGEGGMEAKDFLQLSTSLPQHITSGAVLFLRSESQSQPILQGLCFGRQGPCWGRFRLC